VSQTKSATAELTRRERQVMDILYAASSASVADVQAELKDKPTYSATRMLLQRLEKKGLVSFHMEGAKYIYSPSVPSSSAINVAWRRLVKIFFAGSMGTAFSALLDSSTESLSDAELDELEAVVAAAKAKRK